MVQAGFQHSISAPEIPPEEIVNRTLDPLGRMVMFGVEKAFSADKRHEFATVFRTRHAIADEIERLLAILDALDGDPDLEMNVNADDPRLDDAESDAADDEPSLAGFGAYEGPRAFTDCEQDDADLEPSLGWTLDGVAGDSNDLEATCNG